MGKDKHKDGETATSSETNRDHSRDQEARDAALAKTIAEAVARETQTITEVVAREWQRLMRSIKPQSMRIAHQPCQQLLKLLLDQMVLESWTPSTGQGTRLSTRDGNYGHIKLDLPLMPWEETQRRPRSPIFTIGSTGKVSHR